MLAPTDYEITEAEDGEQALEAIAKQRPDLILMDIQLPIIDGYTATRKSKAILLCDRSRSLPSPPMRSAGRRRKPARLAVMITFRSPSAHVNYWQKSGNTCPKLASFAAVHESVFGTKRTSGHAQSMSAFGSKDGHRPDTAQCPLLTQSGH
jgi:response regulator receiver domain-containing protein